VKSGVEAPGGPELVNALAGTVGQPCLALARETRAPHHPEPVPLSWTLPVKGDPPLTLLIQR